MNRSDKIFLTVLAGAVCLVFGSSADFKALLLDDIIYVGRYHLLTPVWSNVKLWWEPILGLWGPLTGYSFMLDHLLWGKEHLLTGAHCVNILLHFIAAAAFYTGMRMLRFPAAAAGLTVLFWAIHPQRAESVAWLSERKDVLLLALGLWCIVFFLKAVKEKKRIFYGLSVFFFLLGFCIKPALIGLPAILTAFLWGRYRRKEPQFYLKLTGIFWGFSLLYFIVFKMVVPSGNLTGSDGFIHQLTLIGWRYGNYLVKTFIPGDLNPMYPHFSPVHNSLLPLYTAGILILLLAAFLLRKNKKALYLYLPLFISFSAAVGPGLLKIGDVDYADRYSYFPSVFLLLAAASGLCALVKGFPCLRKPVLIGACCLTAGMGIMCFDEVFVWKDNDSYVAATLDTPLPNYRCLVAETIVKFDAGDMAGVRENIHRLRRDYTDVPPIRRLSIDHFLTSLEGIILVRSGQTQAGMKKLIAVLSHPKWELLINTSYGYPRAVLLTTAGICQKAGNRKDAAEMYRRLAGLYGSFEPLEREFYLALAALCQNDTSTALRHFENAGRLNPKDEHIRKNIEILRKKTR